MGSEAAFRARSPRIFPAAFDASCAAGGARQSRPRGPRRGERPRGCGLEGAGARGPRSAAKARRAPLPRAPRASLPPFLKAVTALGFRARPCEQGYPGAVGGPAASARRAGEGGAARLTPRRHRVHRRARAHTRHTSNTHTGARSAESDTRGAVRWRPQLLAGNTTPAELRALRSAEPSEEPPGASSRERAWTGHSSPCVPFAKRRPPSPWSWRRVLRVSRLSRPPARTQLPGVVSSELRSLPRPHRGQGCPALLGRLWPATSQ